MLTLEVVTLIIAGTLVGNEFAIAAFVHPTLTRLPDAVHRPAATALAAILGRLMPFWYALTTLLTAALVFVVYHRTGHWPTLIIAATVLWIIIILFTITTLVPINNRVASWTNESTPADWKTFRHKWDSLHRARVALLTLALILLTVGVLHSPRHHHRIPNPPAAPAI